MGKEHEQQMKSGWLHHLGISKCSTLKMLLLPVYLQSNSPLHRSIQLDRPISPKKKSYCSNNDSYSVAHPRTREQQYELPILPITAIENFKDTVLLETTP